jgi:hypothetical protein
MNIITSVWLWYNFPFFEGRVVEIRILQPEGIARTYFRLMQLKIHNSDTYIGDDYN